MSGLTSLWLGHSSTVIPLDIYSRGGSTIQENAAAKIANEMN